MAARLVAGGKNLQKFLDKVKEQQIAGAVGFFPESTYDDGTQVAQVAMDNEFGYINRGAAAEKYGEVVPPRSFMQGTFNEQNKKWRDELFKAIKNQKENIDIEKALLPVLKIAKNDVQEKIDWWAAEGMPRNGPKVIALKGFDSPLIWSGKMRESVNYRVLKNNGS